MQGRLSQGGRTTHITTPIWEPTCRTLHCPWVVCKDNFSAPSPTRRVLQRDFHHVPNRKRQLGVVCCNERCDGQARSRLCRWRLLFGRNLCCNRLLGQSLGLSLGLSLGGLRFDQPLLVDLAQLWTQEGQDFWVLFGAGQCKVTVRLQLRIGVLECSSTAPDGGENQLFVGTHLAGKLDQVFAFCAQVLQGLRTFLRGRSCNGASAGACSKGLHSWM
mmetsp:Transcript_11986/g.32911  ORF Transcript_11986/g.32911 Transcript_11986/m.32911 type:complete len:217 (+) Transcript_11986:198-848(+)